MKKFLQKKLKEQKGMTLIELLAVIVIIAIIAAIAIPAIGGIIENSRVGAAKSDAQNILSAGELYFLDAPATTTEVTLDKLTAEGFVDDEGSFESAAADSVKVFKKTSTKGTNISGIAKNNNLTITFTTADRNQIEALANSARPTGTAPITVTKN